ncbi:molybdopterin-synthase adenylyltransferase MoeB [Pelistega sp. MC2]|uniref:HesA/MoeB/ThiF family protein n=1 Tax=Pelistega sp. MC2 TaxID=1720297 RepID=UPI0008DB0B1F|nr:molybdopterin-synthase adenylyltransferase MoeB [Pelistega sp. MC2]
MNDEFMLRYARHLMLDGFGFEGQERLTNSKVLILGLGGLGSPVAMYLAAAGVGHLTLVDDDNVELSNLQRQIIHKTDNIGLKKVDSARQTLLALNPLVQIKTFPDRPSVDEITALIEGVDLVLDCSDNYNTRQVLNKICVDLKKPLVAGAAIKWEGMVTSFDFREPTSPCYACLFDPEDNLAPDNCATLGVFSPLLGVIGSMQAVEAIKLLIGEGDTLVGKLAIFNAKTSNWRYLDIKKNTYCTVCQ